MLSYATPSERVIAVRSHLYNCLHCRCGGDHWDRETMSELVILLLLHIVLLISEVTVKLSKTVFVSAPQGTAHIGLSSSMCCALMELTTPMMKNPEIWLRLPLADNFLVLIIFAAYSCPVHSLTHLRTTEKAPL